jgi:hypothetical protein
MGTPIVRACWAAALAGAWSLSACSGSGSGGAGGAGGTGAAPNSLEDFLAAYEQAICDDSAPCCAAVGASANIAACKQLVSSLTSLVLSAASKGTIQYDGANAAECLAAFQQAAASCDQSLMEASACDTVLTGTVQPGGACEINTECIAPPGGDTSCTDGACVQEPRGVAGSPCKGTCTQDGTVTVCSGNGSGDANCYTNDGLRCDESTNLCAAPLPIGASGCSTGDDCVEGAYCDAGTCAAGLPVGSPCTFDECDPGAAFCSSGQCAAKLPDGASCTGSGECVGGACRDAKCGQKLGGLLELVCG